MQIKEKENGISVNGNFDEPNYHSFLKDLKILVHKYESSSNPENLEYSSYTSGLKTPYMEVKGWCSRVLEKSGRISEILFLDYDSIFFWIVKEELKFLMEKYNLPPFYVFSTHEEVNKENNWEFGNYICISLAKKRFKDIIEIHEDTHSDMAHQTVGKHNPYRCWVLRLGNKGNKPAPKFKTIIGDLSTEYNQEISNAHLEALKQLYDIPEIKYTNKDKGKVSDLFLDTYMTASQ